MIHNQLHPLNLPRRVQVQLNNEGLPLAVASDSVLLPGSTVEKQLSDVPKDDVKSVAAILEIWRVEDEWWRQPISRRYVEVVLQGGRHVVLYEDLATGDWFIQRCD
jgi:hypothetical protein